MKRMITLLLAFVLVAGYLPAVKAVENDTELSFGIEQIGNDAVSAELPLAQVQNHTESEADQNEMVRVSIQLEKASTMDAGFLGVTWTYSLEAAEGFGARLSYIVDTLLLESNHDVAMVQGGPYPYHLKQRILGDFGHLSNEQAGEFVRQIAHPDLQHIVLAHISQDCNTPEKARSAMQQTLDELSLSTNLYCAPAAHRLPWINVTT